MFEGIDPMVHKSIRVRFTDRCEIHMGSPYRWCRVRLGGTWTPDLPDAGEGFQDLRAWSDDGNHLALVQWRTSQQGDPAFRIVTISIAQRRIATSRRIRGCCMSLKWHEGAFHYRAYAAASGQVAPVR